MLKLIVVVSGFLSDGGADRALINMLQFLKPDKYIVHLLSFNDQGYFYKKIPDYIIKLPLLIELDFYSIDLINKLKAQKKEDYAILRKDLHSKGKDKNGLVFCWDEIVDYLPGYGNYDIAIAYNLGHPMRYVIDKVVAKKKIGWIHIDYRSKYVPITQSIDIINKYIFLLDRIVCVSDKCKLSFADLFPDLSDRILVIPNINNICEIKKESLEYYPKQFKNNKINIFTASRISAEKGIELLIETAYLLKLKGIDFIWIVAGKNEDKYANYEKMINIMNLNDYIKFIGFVENPYPYYKNCNMYVHTSPYEGKSIAIEEAKILGCAIVTTNYPSVSDSIQDNISGLITQQTPESVSERIIFLINYPENCNVMKEKLSNYEYDNGLELYEKLFQ